MPQIKELPTKKPEVDLLVKLELLSNIAEESQVIVHCSYLATEEGDSIRIWPTTYLYALDSSHKSKLIYAENITLFPNWLILPKGKKHTFTLIFSGLPKSCRHFDLVEEINEPGGFEIRNINRNKSDVYSFDI